MWLFLRFILDITYTGLLGDFGDNPVGVEVVELVVVGVVNIVFAVVGVFDGVFVIFNLMVIVFF